tara:strand:+ start:636 stop:1046 length:411 start_codon:yes stop_codon:yes gene_type:complete
VLTSLAEDHLLGVNAAATRTFPVLVSLEYVHKPYGLSFLPQLVKQQFAVALQKRPKLRVHRFSELERDRYVLELNIWLELLRQMPMLIIYDISHVNDLILIMALQTSQIDIIIEELIHLCINAVLNGLDLLLLLIK